MPRPTHRLDLLLVCPHGPIDAGAALMEGWKASGVLDEVGGPGPGAATLGVGRFARARLDAPSRPTLYANRLGGFRVRCPDDGGFVVEAFAEAMGAYRRGGAASLRCPSCGRAHALGELRFEPPAAFGAWAVEIADIEHLPRGVDLAALLPGTVQVLRRT